MSLSQLQIQSLIQIAKGIFYLCIIFLVVTFYIRFLERRKALQKNNIHKTHKDDHQNQNHNKEGGYN